MDPRGKGFVEVSDSVRSQEEDTGIVLQDSEEDCQVVSPSALRMIK